MYSLLWKKVNRLIFTHEVDGVRNSVKYLLREADSNRTVWNQAVSSAHSLPHLAVNVDSRAEHGDKASGVPKPKVPVGHKIVTITRKEILDSRIVLMSLFKPKEFSRELTVSKYFWEYKCTQYRQFGLYCGYGLYEGLVGDRYLRLFRFLKVFNMLVLGMQGNPPSSKDLDVAQQTVEFFVSECMRLEAVSTKPGTVISVPYSLHLALHLVRYIRTLNVSYAKLSAFGYENFIMELIPKPLRTTNKLLEQIVNRQTRRDLYELNRNPDNTIMRDEEGNPSVGWGGWKGNSKIAGLPKCRLNDSGTIPVLEVGNISISTKFSDSWVLVCADPSDPRTFNNPLVFRAVEFVRAQEAENAMVDGHESSGVFMRGYFYLAKSDLYKEPFPSSLKYEYVFSNDQNLQLAEVPLEAILFKLYVYPRFASMGLDVLSREDLGNNFENVPEWIGTALRH